MVGVKQECYKFHTCICPKCGEKHTRWMFWAGRGMPKVFCRNCNCYRTRTLDCSYMTPADTH